MRFFFLFDKDHDTVHCAPRATLNNKNISSWDLDPSAARDQDPSNLPRCRAVPPPSVSGAPVKLVSDYATRPLRLFGKVWSSSIVYTQFFFFHPFKTRPIIITYTHVRTHLGNTVFYHYYYYCTHLRTIIKIHRVYTLCYYTWTKCSAFFSIQIVSIQYTL